MILNCYLLIFRVQSKQKKGICANIFMTKCVYEPFIELLKVFFNLFKYKTRTAIKKGSSHHCGLPLIRELFKKSSYYQYILFYRNMSLLLTIITDQIYFMQQYNNGTRTFIIVHLHNTDIIYTKPSHDLHIVTYL